MFTESLCENRVEDLKMALRIYKRLLKDENSVFFECSMLKSLLKKTDSELLRLEELLYNQELEDSEMVQEAFKFDNSITEEDLEEMALEFSVVEELKQ